MSEIFPLITHDDKFIILMAEVNSSIKKIKFDLQQLYFLQVWENMQICWGSTDLSWDQFALVPNVLWVQVLPRGLHVLLGLTAIWREDVYLTVHWSTIEQCNDAQLKPLLKLETPTSHWSKLVPWANPRLIQQVHLL